MKTIYKYKLKATYVQRVSIPGGVRPLSVQMKDGGCYMWALVDIKKLAATIDVYAIGTGCRMPDEAPIYINSC
jgi:hypothetical protein